MLPNEIERSIQSDLENSPTSEYDNLKKKFKTYKLSYDLDEFVDLLKNDYPYHYGEGNPKCCQFNINDFRKVTLALALCKIPSFYNLQFAGENVCMAMEDLNYHLKIKDKLDDLFEVYWTALTDQPRRPIKNAIVCHGSVSDISMPIFYFIWNDDEKGYREYLPYAYADLSKLDAGHLDHFLLKITNCLMCLRVDGRDISKWLKIVSKDFSWEKYDLDSEFVF